MSETLREALERLHDTAVSVAGMVGHDEACGTDDCYVLAALATPTVPAGPHVRHGRHCPCSACAREDWTNPDLAPCDYHGIACAYSPAAPPVPAGDERRTVLAYRRHLERGCECPKWPECNPHDAKEWGGGEPDDCSPHGHAVRAGDERDRLAAAVLDACQNTASMYHDGEPREDREWSLDVADRLLAAGVHLTEGGNK